MPLTAVAAALVPEGQNRIIGDIELLAGARIARLAGISAGVLSNLPPDVFLGNLYNSSAPARDFAAVDIAGIGISYDTTTGTGPFPSVVFRQTQAFATSATSHLLVLPAAIALDRVTIAIWTNQAAQVVTTPTGFTLLGKVETTDGEADVYERVYDGSTDPTSPVTITLSVTSSLLARVWNTRFSDPSKPSEIQSQLQNSAAGTTNDLPNLTQTWGTANTLYLFFIGIEVDIGPPNITVFPAGLTNTGQDQHISGTAAVDACIGYGEILSRANSMDLPTCTYGPGRSGAFIIAIPPRPSGSLNWEGLQVTGGNATTGRLTQVSFSNANGISFGLSGSTITASVGAGGAAGSIAVPGSTLGLGQVVFSSSNGVSFGLNGSTMTASVTVAATREIGLVTVVGTSVGSASRLAFANNGTVTWGMTTAAGAATVGIASIAGFTAIGAGTRTCLGPVIILSDSNNVSFGIGAVAGNSVLTASASFPAQTQFVLSNSNGITFGTNVSTVTAQFSSLSFSNANNVSFGIAGSTLTASVTVASTADPQIGLVSHIGGNSVSSVTRLAFSNASNVTWSLSTAANAVTVLASVAAAGGGGITNINVSAGTTSLNLSAFTFLNGGGISFGLSGNSVITASQSTLSFGNANNVTFGIAGSTLTASVTVASTQGSLTVSGGGSSVGLTNLVFTNLNNVGFALSTAAGGGTIRAAASISFSAGTTNAAVSQLSFDNAGGVSFGLNGSTITATSPNDQIGAISVVGGVTSGINITRLAFSNQANVTLALITAANQATIRFSVDPPQIGLVSHIGGNSVSNVTRLAFSNASNVTFSLSTAVSAVTVLASVNAGGGGGIGLAAAGATQTSGTVAFTNNAGLAGAAGSQNTNNVFFSLDSAAVGSLAATALFGIEAGNAITTFNPVFATGFKFINSNGVTFGTQSTSLAQGRLVLITAQSSSPVVSAGTTAQTLGNLSFDDTARFKFGINGSTITGEPLIQISNSGGSVNVTRIVFGSQTGIAVNFSMSTGVGIGTIRADIQASDISAPPVYWYNGNVPFAGGDANGTAFLTGSMLGQMYLFPLGGMDGNYPPSNMTVNDFGLGCLGVAVTDSGSFGMTLRGGLFTAQNATRLNLFNSFVSTYTQAASATSAGSISLFGDRFFRVVSSQWSSQPVIPNQQVWMGLYASCAGKASALGIRLIPIPMMPFQAIGFHGLVGQAVASVSQLTKAAAPFWGGISTTNIPASIDMTQMIVKFSSHTIFGTAVNAYVPSVSSPLIALAQGFGLTN